MLPIFGKHICYPSWETDYGEVYLLGTIIFEFASIKKEKKKSFHFTCVFYIFNFKHKPLLFILLKPPRMIENEKNWSLITG